MIICMCGRLVGFFFLYNLQCNSYTDHIFCIRQILEKKLEYNKAVHQLLTDF